MSNKIQLQTNNTDLDALITRVNAAKDTATSLPDAGSGGGSVETCTMTLLRPFPCDAAYVTIDDNGNMVSTNTGIVGGILMDVPIVCGSFVFLIDDSIDFASVNLNYQCTGCEIIHKYKHVVMFKVTAQADDVCSIFIHAV